MTKLELEIYKCYIDSDEETKIKNLLIPLYEKRGGNLYFDAQALRAGIRFYEGNGIRYARVGLCLLKTDYMIKFLNLLEKYNNLPFNEAFDKALHKL